MQKILNTEYAESAEKSEIGIYFAGVSAKRPYGIRCEWGVLGSGLVEGIFMACILRSMVQLVI